MTVKSKTIADEPLDDTQEVEAEAPEQTATHKWEFKPRQSPKWGTVTKEGLIVGRGTTKKVIPPDEVYYLASLGVTYKELGEWFGVPEDTLRYNFKPYVEKAREETRQRLRQAQIKLALSGNAVMLIWLGKNMLGQSDNPQAVDTDKVLPWNDEV
jgi:hypothetical protein